MPHVFEHVYFAGMFCFYSNAIYIHGPLSSVICVKFSVLLITLVSNLTPQRNCDNWMVAHGCTRLELAQHCSKEREMLYCDILPYLGLVWKTDVSPVPKFPKMTCQRSL